MITENSTSNKNSSSPVQKTYVKELVVLTSLFFMWGFITVLNDILIPHLKAIFSLNYFQAMLVQFSFFGAYFLVSIPAGFLINKFGYKNGIIIGLITASIGCLVFYPSAIIASYPLFLTALFILAGGITIIEVAANPYVTILGPAKTASSRLNLTQAFTSLGTTLAPLFGAVFILAEGIKATSELAFLSAENLSTAKILEAATVKAPYLGIAAILIVLAAVIAMFKLPKINEEQEPIEIILPEKKRKSAWSFRHLTLGAVGIFVYVGAEVAIGSFLVNYISQDFVLGIKEAEAGKYISFYWGGAMVGRFIGSYVLTKLDSGKVLSFNAAVASILVITTMLTTGHVAMWSILLVGLFNSIMFSNIFALSIEGLGKFRSQGSGILFAANVGGAIIPLLQGSLADTIGIQYAFIIPVICYWYLVFYGMKGSKKVQLNNQVY